MCSLARRLHATVVGWRRALYNRVLGLGPVCEWLAIETESYISRAGRWVLGAAVGVFGVQDLGLGTQYSVRGAGR